MADEIDVAGEHLREQRSSGVGDGDRDPPLVVGGRRPCHQAGFLEEACLIGQAAAAVDHAIGQVGHAVASGRRIAEAGQELELHVAKATGFPQLLLDRVPKQADHLDEGEVGAELDGVEGRGWSRHVRSLLASNSKRCYAERTRCFKFEAHPRQTK
jgi:hypothetical protein